MKRSITRLLCLVLITAVFLTGCGKTQIDEKTNEPTPQSATNTTQGEFKDTINIGLFTSPTGVFNPLYADSDYDIIVNNVVFSTLLELNDKKELIPCLAERYEISQDGKTITFFLRKDVTWHDKTPFTAKDVYFTFNSLAQKDYLGPLYGIVSNMVGAKDVREGLKPSIEGIKLIDDYTISFTYEEVYSPGLIRIGTEVGIVSENIWSKVPINQWKESTDLLNKPIGTGPYVFKEFVPGQFVKLESNPSFFRGDVKTKNLIYQIKNQETAIASLTNGEIDLADVSNFKPQDIEQLKSNNLNITSFPGKSYQYMGFNMRLDIFKSKELRQAITYAIDRKTVIDKLIGGNATLINAPMLPNTWQYPKTGLNEFEYNPEKAKELLSSLGYSDSNQDGFVDKDGKNLTLTLKYPIGNKIREQYGAIIQKNLKDVGIEVELKSMEFSTLLSEAMENHEFEMYLMGSSLSLDPDPTPYWSSSAASDEKGVAAWNIPGYRNSKADELMVNGLKTINQEERAAIYQEFAVMFNDDPPVVLLYAPNITKAYNQKLMNYSPTTFVDFYNVHEWQIAK
ncbi:ABC transporter substrate-binding protein [Guggenheimella bovis]